MDKKLLTHLEDVLNIKIMRVSTVSGGDISRAFLLESETEKFFCKVHNGKDALNMFLAERKGLNTLRKTNTIAVPKVFWVASYEKGAFLVMEYIEGKTPSSKEMELLGFRIAQLHLKSNSSCFGLESDNYIGNMHQSNKEHKDWPTFYVGERLVPQFKIAFDKGLLNKGETPLENSLLHVCNSLFPKLKPSLVHGDLWSGNFLISKLGVPFLIDPAVYYGHHEIDIAMTKLFSGFGGSFYRAYREIIPPEHGEKERLDIYQLYYLLVHLNLFGPSYKTPIKRIITTYF